MKYFYGHYFTAPKYGEFKYDKALIVANSAGLIEAIYNENHSQFKTVFHHAENSPHFIKLKEGQYFLPGFIDLHVHASQWPQAGVSLDEPLHVWLNERTFPLEAKFNDLTFAESVYINLVKHLLARGTTTAVYFATIHRPSSFLLAKICAELGQRALVGKVVVDKADISPEFYRDLSTDHALAETEIFINDVNQLNTTTPQGVYPVVTPRFVPSCTDEALKGLGELAQKYNTHVQSHCSEGEWQHHHVLERFGKRDTEVFLEFGLLGRKSVMAHCNFLNHNDGRIFAETGATIAHCPISNIYFANSVLPLKRLKEQGVTIGLGTDISGGFSPSLYENLKQTVLSARQLEEGVDTHLPHHKRGVANSRVSMTEAFYLVTSGGGEALDLPIGQIREGYACDLQIVDINSFYNQLPQFGLFNEPEQILHKILYLSSAENIANVYVQGREVFNRSH